MDAESLIFLLRGGHYSMPERLARGIWPHPPLRFEALVEQLADVIRNEQWFPCKLEPHRSGEPVGDWGIIERVAPDKFIYYAQRGHAHDPFTIAETSTTTIDGAHAAARKYLKWSLHLPGDLDSWRVI